LAKINQEAVLCDIALSVSDDWIYKIVVKKIKTSSFACRIIVVSSVPDELKLTLADRITDERFLVDYVKNQKFPELVRRKCIENLKDENSFISLLKHSPVLENWVIAYSISNVAESEILVYSVLNKEFNQSNRLLAYTKLKSPMEYISVFENAFDDLSVKLSLRNLPLGYIKSKDGQMALVRNFRLVKDDLLKKALFVSMSDNTLMKLYKNSDQVMIAKVIALSPLDDVLAKAKKALFDNDVIFNLAIGKFSKDDKITYWALDLNPGEEIIAEIALKSENLSTQCRALARISDEFYVVRIALHAKKRVLRMAAIARLSKKSESALNKLAQDEDTSVKMAAIKQLKVVGSDKVSEFERQAKLEQQKKAEYEKKLAEEQKEYDRKQRDAYEHKYLSTAGTIQLSVLRKYLELNNRVRIKSSMFQFTGRVTKVDGRKITLEVFYEKARVRVFVEMSKKAKDVFSKGEIVTIAGYDDESTNDRITLRCGELIKRGIVDK
jgi:hypothetical protein